MAQLNDQQIDTILERILADDVKNKGLQTDLLDHYCCFIEERLDSGTNFDDAYQAAFKAISPNGMHEIQEELFFLLTFKKQTNIKRLIYSSGFLASFFISFGFLFKLMHWPGGTVTMATGFSMLIIASLVFIANAIRHIKAHNRWYNLSNIAGVAGMVLVSAGSLLKIAAVHAYANVSLTLGMILLNGIFLPIFFYNLYSQPAGKQLK